MRTAPLNFVSEDQYSAPVPVLGKEILFEPDRRPRVAAAAEYLAVLSVGLYVLVPVASSLMCFSDGKGHFLFNDYHSTISFDSYTCLAELMVLPVGLALVAMGLAMGLHQRKALAWWCQIVLAVYGLLLIPLGTIIYGLLLVGWFQRSTRAWYHVN